VSRPPCHAERRGTCLWLAELATRRGGTIGLLRKSYQDLDEVLERPRSEIAALLTRSPAPGGGAAGASRSGKPPRSGGTAAARETGGDRSGWRAALGRLAPDMSLTAPPGGIVVTYVDDAYPPGLRHLYDPPPALFVLGAGDAAETGRRLAEVLRAPRVVVVGTRGPSPYGLDMAAGIARDLVREGCVVISGLAYGIDAAAHRGALEEAASTNAAAPPLAGPAHAAARIQPLPPTVAVMGCGADVCYPRAHRSLRRRILHHGLIVSEFLWGVPVHRWRFPSRNRVLGALGHATVVVEGGPQSGALITARHALDVSREILAVPGEAGRQTSEGPHGLLREGATICESALCVAIALIGIRGSDPGVLRRWSASAMERIDPVLLADGLADDWELMAPSVDEEEASADCGRPEETDGRPDLDRPDGERRPADARDGGGRPSAAAAHAEAAVDAEQLVWTVVDAGQSHVDAVVGQSGLPVGKALAALGALEAKGRVAVLPDGTYRAVRGRRRPG
jgi:DNA processing protein